MQEIMIAIVLGIAVGCSDLLNYNVKKWLSRFSTVSLFIMLLCLEGTSVLILISLKKDNIESAKSL